MYTQSETDLEFKRTGLLYKENKPETLAKLWETHELLFDKQLVLLNNPTCVRFHQLTFQH